MPLRGENKSFSLTSREVIPGAHALPHWATPPGDDVPGGTARPVLSLAVAAGGRCRAEGPGVSSPLVSPCLGSWALPGRRSCGRRPVSAVVTLSLEHEGSFTFAFLTATRVAAELCVPRAVREKHVKNVYSCPLECPRVRRSPEVHPPVVAPRRQILISLEWPGKTRGGSSHRDFLHVWNASKYEKYVRGKSQ